MAPRQDSGGGQERPSALARAIADDPAAKTAERGGFLAAQLDDDGDQAENGHDGEPGEAGDLTEDELAVIELADEEARQAAECLQRRYEDLELRTALELAGFQGPEWARFAHELARYGLAVVMAWLHTGEMFAQCKKKNCPVGAPPDDWSEDDRSSIANETVAQAIVNFRRNGLLGGGWSFDGGASLKTYFIGACVFAFPNPFRRWKNEQDNLRELHGVRPRVIDDPDVSWLPRTPDVADASVAHMHIWDAFNAIPNKRAQRAALLNALGYSNQEIADVLDTTPAAVAELLRRQRRRADPTDRGAHDG